MGGVLPVSSLFRHLGPSWREEVADALAANIGVLGDIFFTTSDHRIRFTTSPGKAIIFDPNNAAETTLIIETQETDAFLDMITDSAGVESYITSVSDSDTTLGVHTNAVLLAMIAISHALSDTKTNSLTFEINSGGFKVTLDTANVILNFTLDLNKVFRFIEAVIPLADAVTDMFSIEDETDPSQTNASTPFGISATSTDNSGPPFFAPLSEFKAYNDSNFDALDNWTGISDPASIPQNLAIDFGAGNGKVIDRYRFLTRNDIVEQHEPNDWEFWGSNVASPDLNTDGDWTSLDVETSQPDIGQNTLSQFYSFF